MLPFFVSHLLFPAHERLLHRPTFQFLQEIEDSQWLSGDDMLALQERKLAELLRLCAKHSPWHAERIRHAGLDLTKTHISRQELACLPTMSRTDAQLHGAEMVWKEAPGGVYSYNTGGSSGTPLIFHFGRLRQASDAASRMRARRWWGVNVGEREVLLWGSPVELSKTDRLKTLRDRLFNQLVLNAFDMSPEVMDGYLSAMVDYRPTCIYGYASSLALLAGHAKSRGRQLGNPALKVVCCTGEPLYPPQKQLIEEVYGVAAAGEYGSRDAGFIAHQSPAGQWLVNSESVILELLDPQGEPVPTGELGEVVITGLCSEAQPFIRYRTGDMARASEQSCAEGRGLPVLEEIVGRQTDFVVAEDGRIMHALALIYVLRAIDGVESFKIIQHQVSQLEVQVVANNAWNADASGKVRDGLRQRLGPNVAVEVQRRDHITPDKSGKFRYVVSHVDLAKHLHRQPESHP